MQTGFVVYICGELMMLFLVCVHVCVCLCGCAWLCIFMCDFMCQMLTSAKCTSHCVWGATVSTWWAATSVSVPMDTSWPPMDGHAKVRHSTHLLCHVKVRSNNTWCVIQR